MVPSVEHDGLIDLTSATADDLCRLVGVGPALASRIVAWRDENGGFASVDQLAGIKGIGQSRLELLRPQVVVRPAGPQADGGAGQPPHPQPPVDPGPVIEDEPLDGDVLPPAPVRSGPRRALARRRLPAVVDAPGPRAEPERSFAAFLRDNSVNAALLGLAVAAQLLVIVLVVWVL
jgi:competence ComEA-like helix-hairpin-helix protein